MKIVKMQGPVERGTEVIRFHRPLCKSNSSGTVEDRKRRLSRNGGLDQSGSPKLKGAGAPRAWSEAHRRLDMARRGAQAGAAWRGRGTALRASGRDHHAASSGPAAPPQPQPVPVTCASLKDVWAIPPPARRPGDAPARGLPEVKQKTQKGNRTATAGRNIHQSPIHGRGNPAGQVEDESSC